MDTTAIDPHVLKTIADHVRRGECILFLGAGVHAPPPADATWTYPDKERPPIGAGLAKLLAAQSDFAARFKGDSPTDLQRVAMDYEVLHKRNKLIQEIRQAVQDGKRPSPVLRAVARLKFPLVATTNYDQLFERALQDTPKDPKDPAKSDDRKQPVVSVYKSNVTNRLPTDSYPYNYDPTPEQPFIVKLHGDVAAPTESIVITDEDYIHFVMRMTEAGQYAPLPDPFPYRFKKWPTLFIGFSFRDYNLRLLFKTLRWNVDPVNIPQMYSVDFAPDPLIVNVWESQYKLVTFIAQDVWKFVPALYREVTGEDMP